MADRLGLLRTERLPQRVHLAQRHSRCFDVELARLCEECFLVKVVHREKRAGALTCSRRENRRIGESESALVKKVTSSANDLRANTKNRTLTPRAHPEMAVLHQEVDAAPFTRHGEWIVFRDTLND